MLPSAPRRPVLVVLLAALFLPGIAGGLLDTAREVPAGPAVLVAPSVSSEIPGEPDFTAGAALEPAVASLGADPLELPRPAPARLQFPEAGRRPGDVVLPVASPPPRPA